MSKHLTVILGILAIAGFTWGAWTYLDRYALCADLQKTDQKLQKTMDVIEWKFKALQVDNLDERIYKTEERVKQSPNDVALKEDLAKLKKDKEKALRDMKMIEEKK